MLLDADTLSVLDGGKSILNGSWDNSTGMWEIKLPIDNHLNISHHIGKQSTSYMVAFVYSYLFPPTLSTLEKAFTNGYLINFPGITTHSLLNRPPTPESVTMTKGHLDLTRMNQC